MKKRLLAILLAVVMLAGIAPVAMAVENDSELILKYMDWNTKQPLDWVERWWTSSPGHRSHAFFYLSPNEDPIAPSELSSSDETVVKVTAATSEGENVVILDAVAFGTAEIIYTKNGVEYKLPVTVDIPSYGFYRDDEVSQENYISTFEQTETNNTFYFMTDSAEKTITDIVLDSESAKMAHTEQISDNCWKITVDGFVDNSHWISLTYSGFDGWSDFEGWDNSIKINDARPSLVYNYESSAGWFNRSLSFSPGNKSYINVYLSENGETTKLKFEDLSLSGENCEEIVEFSKIEEDDRVCVKALDFGTANICYTYNGKILTIPVTVELPDFGYYKTSTVSQESYIGPNTAFNFTGENDILYFLAKTGDDNTRIISNLILREDFAKVAKAEKVTDTCWEITFTGIPAGWYAADANHTKNSSTWTNQYSINFNDVRPGFKLRRMAWDNDGCYEDTNWPMQSTWENAKGYLDTIKFYFFENGVGTPVALKDISIEGDAVSFAASGDFIEIEAIEFGTSTVSYSANGKIYSIEFNVTLPNVGAYTGPERTEENYMFGIDLAKAENGVIWLIKDGGFTGNMSMTLDGEPFEDFEIVVRDDGNYDVKLDFSNTEIDDWSYLQINYGPNNNSQGFSVQYEVRGNAAYVGDYAIGFAWDDEDTGITTINEGDWMVGNGGSEIVDTYELFRELKIAAGIKKTDEQGNAYYEVVEKDNKIKVEISKVWIEEIKGEKDVFSLSSDGLVEEKTDYTGKDVIAYSKSGFDSTIYLKAELKVTVGKETTTETISTGCFTHYVPTFYEERPADDTTEKLNAYFEEMSDDVITGATYTVKLAPVEYTGTIVLPEAFRANYGERDLFIQGSVDDEGNATIIRGGIDFNSVTVSMISDLHFKGDDTYTKGIYNGSLLNMAGCSFQGYVTAIDASKGTVTLTEGNVFVGNDTAVYFDIAPAATMAIGMNRNPWTNNTFINNGTAIHVKSLNKFISSYYFRVVDSNFIGNGKDFDVDCAATLYMQRDYYGNIHNQAADMPINDFVNKLETATSDTKLNQTVTSNSPNIDCIKDSKAIISPKMKKPILDWWKSEAAIEVIFPVSEGYQKETDTEEKYENKLVADWKHETQIINDESDDLIIDKESFDEVTEDEKKIDVVDKDENPVGTWNFK